MNEIRKEELVNPAYLRTAGMNILPENLGVAGAARFIQQFMPGSGDYTKERAELLAAETIDSFEAALTNLKGEK